MIDVSAIYPRPPIYRPPVGQPKGAVMSEMAKTDRFAKVDVGIENQGTKIVLPATPDKMSPAEGILALQRRIEQDNMRVDVYEEIDALPLDGAHALAQVLKARFGWAAAVPKRSFFGDQPPKYIDVETDYGKSTQVVWGQMELPGVQGRIETGATNHSVSGRHCFVLSGDGIRQKDAGLVKIIANEVREYLKEGSIYKGKAFRLKMKRQVVDASKPPTFLDVEGADPSQLIFPRDVMREVQASLFTPIMHTDAVRRAGVPLRRGVLLAGPFGVGKTLTANIVAKLCKDHGWTYIYIDDVRGLEGALLYARQYQPCVVFAEDVDRAVSERGGGNAENILNTIDGVESKGVDVVTILTTNYPENIEAAMLRPGRLDSVINVTAPDAEAVERLIRLYGGDLVDAAEDLTGVGETLSGQIPAVVREVVERAKLHAIGLDPEAPLALSSPALQAAARAMAGHLALLNLEEDAKTDEQLLGETLARVTRKGFNGELDALPAMKELVDEIHNATV